MPSVRRTFFEAVALCMAIYHFARYLWRLQMSKTTAGILLTAGIFIAIIAKVVGSSAANTSNMDPSLDAYYAMIEYGSIAGIVAGLGLFFWGAVAFARK